MAGLEGRKVAFVTGAGSGIGRGTARAFLEKGYVVALVDRDEKNGRAVEEELRALGDCTFIRCDVTNDESVAQAVDKTVELYGRIDAAFNAAGIDGESGKPTAEATLENWNRVIAIDLTGTFSCMRYQLRQMLKQGSGSIVNCSSLAGILGAPGLPAYVAAKHGVVGLAKAAAVEYARQGIRVNCVCPGMIVTPMSEKGFDPALMQTLLDEAPMNWRGEPQDIASAVIWLCDDSARFVTGQAINVDGGFSAR